jgi:hypothetical protein
LTVNNRSGEDLSQKGARLKKNYILLEIRPFQGSRRSIMSVDGGHDAG